MPKDRDPLRECCLTREQKPASELLRFALGPDDELVPDVDAKAPGRGVWITPTAEAVDEAVRKKAFARGLKQAVRLPDELAKLADRRLEERLLGALGLARKAGALTTGATKVQAAIAANNIVGLFIAADAAADSRRKMLASLKAAGLEDRVSCFELLQSDQLNLALGLENVIHAALVAGPAAHSALQRAKRLARYRGIGRKEELNI